MNQEIKTILFIMGARPEGFDRAELSRLTQEEWSSIVRKAMFMRVDHVVYQYIIEHKLEAALDRASLADLRENHLKASYENIQIFNQLSQILKALEREGIEAIPLKGAHIAKFFYSDISFRPMADIDILVKKTDFQRVDRALLELKYQSFDDSKAKLKHHFHVVFVPRGRGSPIEVHWDLVRPGSPYQINIECLWELAEETTLEGSKARLLPREALIMHLCLNSAYNDLFRGGLFRLYDIRKIIAGADDELNWDMLASLSNEWNMIKPVFLMLLLARNLLDAGVPDAFLDNLRPADFNPLIENYAAEKILDITSGFPLNRKMTRLLKKQSLKGKLRLAKEKLAPPREFIADKYSSPAWPLVPLFYLLNLKDALKTVFREAARLSKGSPKDRELLKVDAGLMAWFHGDMEQ